MPPASVSGRLIQALSVLSTYHASAGAYLDVQKARSINELTINDYTLLSNSERVVTMSNSSAEERNAEALVVINQVAYNTTYTIDFLKDGENSSRRRSYKASKLSISPGSWEDEDDGSCIHAGSESFSEDGGGDKDWTWFHHRYPVSAPPW